MNELVAETQTEQREERNQVPALSKLFDTFFVSHLLSNWTICRHKLGRRFQRQKSPVFCYQGKASEGNNGVRVDPHLVFFCRRRRIVFR